MKSLNSKGTTGGTPNTMVTKLSSPKHTHTHTHTHKKRMWEIGLSLWWYFVTECRSIQVISQGSGRESPHGSRNFQRKRRALKEKEREREESPNGISQQPHDPRRLWCIGDDEFELTPIKARKKNLWEFELHPCLKCGHAIVFLTSKSASTGRW
jgi:hypothetical protein